MPGGSHLEMRTEIDGVKLIAIGSSKYNSKKTQLHLVTEGAGPTTPGLPYIATYHDELGNVLTREVSRPAVVSRYFKKFNMVDVHDQRQHELGLERKWVGKNEIAGKFRLWTTVRGVTAIDTMLAVQTHSNPANPIRSKTTREFIELLADEMIDNELDGALSRPPPAKRARPAPSALDMPEGSEATHQLATIGRASDVKPLTPGKAYYLIQYRCSICSKHCTTYCKAPGCESAPVCNSHKRGCFAAHCTGGRKPNPTATAREGPATKQDRRMKRKRGAALLRGAAVALSCAD